MHFTFASAEALSAFSFTLSLSLSVLLNLLWSAVEEGRREGVVVVVRFHC